MYTTGFIATVREKIKEAREKGKKIILIPTMGFLHPGHLGMVEETRKRDRGRENLYIVMSIFVNPLQFGPQEDYATYPRDLERDKALAERAGVDLLFAPSVAEMYPEGRSLTTVQVSEITEVLCGVRRPGHFQGVATVVTKLFNIVSPDEALFGQKDYQQALVIKQLVKDLNISVVVNVFPTVREKDGLALSSRNSYLSPKEREQAPILFQALQEAALLIKEGERRTNFLCEKIKQRIESSTSGKIEYVEIRRAQDLSEIEEIDSAVVIALAAKFGSTRLIDNLIVEVEKDV
ncbi:MAG: pantoate--beta-alanine ligase [Desulfitobacteriia bacterium]|jgi:pantoate--beta-alanine ligase